MKNLFQCGAILTVALLSFVSLCGAPHAAKFSPDKNSTFKATDAATLFAKHCATCHGKDGQAKTFKAKFNHARNLTDATWQQSVTDERLFTSINHGKGKMPAFGKKLSPPEIESLVGYVRAFKK